MGNLKPILKIDNFSGSGINGILYSEGFYPEVDNGKSVMSEGYYTNTLFNSSTTGMTDISYIKSIIPLSSINSISVVYQLYYNGSSLFAYTETDSSYINQGLIHSSIGSISYPDMLETSLGNILYTQESYVGLGTRGKATGGSTTTLIDIT